MTLLGLDAVDELCSVDMTPVLALGERCLFLPKSTRCWFWCVAQEDTDWCRLEIVLDPGVVLPYWHWLSYEMDAVGSLEDSFGLTGASPVRDMLLEHGIAPGQPFLVRATYWAGRDYFGEYDSEVRWGIVDVERWPEERVAEAWEAYLGRCHLLVGQ